MRTATSAVRKAGMTYPMTRPWEAHHELPAAYMERHLLLPASMLDTDPRPVWAQWCRDAGPTGHMLLSSEAFWELLTYMPDSFGRVVELMGATHDIHVIYLVREPHSKAWSALRHLSREGLRFDPEQTYSSDLELTLRTERSLGDYFEPAQLTRVDFTGGDAVGLFLDHLLEHLPATDDPLVGDGGRALSAAYDKERHGGGVRANVAPDEPTAAAITFAVTLGLWQEPGLAASDRDLPKLYEEILVSPSVPLPADLPDDRTLHARLRAGEALITADEAKAVHGWLTDPALAAAAGTAHQDALKRCVAAVAHLLPTPVA